MDHAHAGPGDADGLHRRRCASAKPDTTHPAGNAPVAAQESSLAGQPAEAQTEANLVLPDLGSVSSSAASRTERCSCAASIVCVLGLLFGLVMYMQLKNLPVHRSMREISELIYETCKTYLHDAGQVHPAARGLHRRRSWSSTSACCGTTALTRTAIIIIFSLVGIAGSYGVAWFGIRVNTFANSRSAFASLRGKPFPTYDIPLKAGMSIGMLLISTELVMMLFILLFVPRDYAGPCFIGFAIGESLGAAALRIAGGIFTKIADIGSDLMKIVFNIKEDDARNPGVIADCTGDNAGDSVGPTADGFETYGVTGVALITFILLAVSDPMVQTQLLVWIFVMRVLMIITSAVSYWINGAIAAAKYSNADTMNFEAPLTSLVWITSILSVGVTYVVSYLLIPTLGGDATMWWKLSTIITCGTLAGAIIPELVKVFTSTESRHVREVVTASREGGASLNILAGLIAGNFSAYWMGITIAGLMGVGAVDQQHVPGRRRRADDRARRSSPSACRLRLPRHGPGDDRRRLLRPGHGQRAVGLRAVDDRDRSPASKTEIKRDFGFAPVIREGQGLPRGERRRGQHVQGHGQAGAHRHRGRRRDHDDLLDHRDAHQRADRRTWTSSRCSTRSSCSASSSAAR